MNHLGGITISTMPFIHTVSVPTYSSRAWVPTCSAHFVVHIQLGVACVGQLCIPACISASPAMAATRWTVWTSNYGQKSKYAGSLLRFWEKSVFDSASPTSPDVMFLLKGASSRCLQLQDTVSLFSCCLMFLPCSGFVLS